MKYLVLGSSGQIGLELTDFLRKNNHTVFELDLIRSSDEDLRTRFNSKLINYLQEVDFVFFLAFDVGGSVYLKKYQHTFDFVHNNSLINSFTFEQLHKYKTPFIYASSQMSNMSYSPYGVAKAQGEVYSRILNGIVVKFWNVYGIENDPEKTHVITDFINSARLNKSINMRTNGVEERQFLHAEDCSRALLKLSEEYSTLDRDEEYHITSFEWNSILEIAQIISKHYNVPVIPSNDVDTVQLNKRNEPNKHILNYWKPTISLEKGIQNIIESI